MTCLCEIYRAGVRTMSESCKACTHVSYSCSQSCCMHISVSLLKSQQGPECLYLLFIGPCIIVVVEE